MFSREMFLKRPDNILEFAAREYSGTGVSPVPVQEAGWEFRVGQAQDFVWGLDLHLMSPTGADFLRLFHFPGFSSK